MVKKRLMSERQREEVEEYLAKRPNKMSGYVRGVRMAAKKLDFKQLFRDLKTLETLANLDVQIGRKSSDYRELKAEVTLAPKDDQLHAQEEDVE